jgi:hypothetical protein
VNIFTVCLNQADMKCTTLLGIFCLSTVLVSSSVGLSPRILGRRNKEAEGRYTRNIKDYEVLAPRKLNQDGDFLSYSLLHFYEHDPSRRRKRPATNIGYIRIQPLNRFQPNLVYELFRTRLTL